MSDGLNPSQRQAVETLAGPLLVLAGAGSGKTRVVTYRIANLIRHGAPPSRILAVTFTNKAAAEMHERALALLGKQRKERPEISTFHSLCVRILRRHARRLGYPEKFSIYDRGDQESAARAALREIKVDEASLRPGDLIHLIGRWKTHGIGPEQAAAHAVTDKEHLASIAYRRYQRAIKAAGAMDFDDLLLRTEELFERFAEVRRAEAARFGHLLIDEYQDTNGSQYRLVRALAAGHRNLCVVGDDDQSIYGWRGAEVTHILRFKQDWPDAKVVRLEENYRSTAAILHLANTLIRFNKHRHDKVLRAARAGGEKPTILQAPDETAEAQMVVADVAARLADPQHQPRDFAILFRTNEQPRAFETELRKAKLPYVLIGGMSFFDRREVRDVLAYAKLLVRPQDEPALLRIVNTPPRGIGQATVAQLMQRAVASGRAVWDVMRQPDEIDGVSPVAAEAIGRFCRLVESFRRRLLDESPTAVLRALVCAIGYQDELARVYKEPQDQQARWAAVEEVINALAAFEQRNRRATLQGFLDEVALGDRAGDDEKQSALRRNAVVLMTLHAAKGLEFPQVYMVGMEEGLLPHHRSLALDGEAIDEERRLCYVGITRAQDRLTLSLALARMKWGKPRPTQPSRFLYELTGQAERAPRPGAARPGGAGKCPSPGGKKRPRPKQPARPDARSGPRRRSP